MPRPLVQVALEQQDKEILVQLDQVVMAAVVAVLAQAVADQLQKVVLAQTLILHGLLQLELE